MSRLILSSRATAVIVAIMVAFVLGVLVGQKDVRDGVRDDMRKCKVDNYCHSKGANFSIDAFGRVKVHEDGKKKGRP
jgi:hypothetical protein